MVGQMLHKYPQLQYLFVCTSTYICTNERAESRRKWNVFTRM